MVEVPGGPAIPGAVSAEPASRGPQGNRHRMSLGKPATRNTGVPFVAGNRYRYQRAMEKGQELIALAQWRDAISAYRIAINEFPRQPEPYVGLGEACFQLKQLDRALDCFKLAARLSGGHIDHLRRVADLQERQGMLQDASRTYLAAGELLLRRRQLDDAISHWERSVRLAPNLLGGHRRLAMVFQRLGDTRGAVRQYLAIARILQMQGEPDKALRMCQAALRLDPGNEDVLTAIDMVKYGEDAFAGPELPEEAPDSPAAPDEETPAIADIVRQMADKLEAEKANWTLAHQPHAADDPVAVTRRFAQDQLAAEIFRDEDEGDALYGAAPDGLSKLERDALIGQGIDFESRGNLTEAIEAYEKAVAGGLTLPAALFNLGLLYARVGRALDATRTLTTAAEDERFHTACRQILADLE